MEKYSWGFMRDGVVFRDGADSVEGCIALAKAAADDEDTVYIGENVALALKVNAENVLDALEEQASDDCGEVADDWDAYDCETMQPELEELSAELTAITVAWLKKHGKYPSFFSVENARAYSLLGTAEDGRNGTPND